MRRNRGTVIARIFYFVFIIKRLLARTKTMSFILDGCIRPLPMIAPGAHWREPHLYEILSSSANVIAGNTQPQAVLANWVGISKIFAKNHFGEWGLVEFPSIKPRGVRDLSYLVMSKTQKPMHFSDVARAISDAVGKKTHIQTVHNELIKDNRFVLVGRGLYALREWGYEEGTVKDTITRALKEHGSLPKEKIVELVLARRFVKPNTITVNLDNRTYFRKLHDGRYALA